MKLVLIESVEAFKLYKLEKADPSESLFCTHNSVKDYAWSLYCEKVKDLSEYINNDDIASYLNLASIEMQDFCNELDQRYSEYICKIFGLNVAITIFSPLYYYKGIFKLASKFAFEESICRILKNNVCTEIKFYRYKPEGRSNPIFEMDDVLRKITSSLDIPLNIIFHNENNYKNTLISLMGRLRRVRLNNLISRVNVSFQMVKFSPIFLKKTKKNILLYLRVSRQEVLDSIAKSNNFKKINIDGANLYKFRHVNLRDIERNFYRKVITHINELKYSYPNNGSVMGNIFMDFKKNCREYMLPALYYQEVLDVYDVKSFIWQYPVCINQELSILNEYLLKKGIRVIGVQHGANYVSQNLGSIHFASDFNRCNYFLTYGWGIKEFEESYGHQASTLCNFIPIGSSELKGASIEVNKINIDVVFPITNCAGMMDVCRQSESIIVQYQGKILKALNSRSDLITYIKPERGYGWHNFAWTEGIRRFENLRIGRETFTEFMKMYAPKLVIIEFPSTPLYDVLGYDIDIFLLNDPVHEFSEHALNLLKKRVHLFDDIDELVIAIEKYSHNPILKKRDQDFFHAYVNCIEKNYQLI